MAEGITLLLFLLQICLCIMTGRDILYALAGSLLCFSTYCFYRGHSVKQLFRMWMIGIKRIKGILIILMAADILLYCYLAFKRCHLFYGISRNSYYFPKVFYPVRFFVL